MLSQETSPAKAMPDSVRSRILAAALLAGLLGLIGIVMVLLLLRSWRRYNDRIRQERTVTPVVDIWSASAQRVAPPNSSEGNKTVDYDDSDVSRDGDADEDDDQPGNEPRDDNGDPKHG